METFRVKEQLIPYRDAHGVALTEDMVRFGGKVMGFRKSTIEGYEMYYRDENDEYHWNSEWLQPVVVIVAEEL